MITIAIACVALLGAISVFSSRRLVSDRLAMQWNLREEVNWTAPRAAALAFTPVLAAVVLAAVLGAGGDSGEVLLVSGLFLGVHLLHMGLLIRAERRPR